MKHGAAQSADPWGVSAVLALGFWGICLIRLGIPSTPYFDEVHYLPAARELLEFGAFTNREHPLFGKILIAAGIGIFGDNPWGWRIMPTLAGAGMVYGLMRAAWHATRSRFAALAYGVLVATGVLIFVHARVAMLDIFCMAFLSLALWQGAAAIRKPEQGRWRLALCGIALGLAMASKWNAAIIAPLFGLGFLAMRMSAGRRRLLLSRRGAPVPGITLLEAALWLGAVPLAVYAATFWPAYHFAIDSIGSTTGASGLIAHHADMARMQSSVVQPHPYQSEWWQWAANLRGIWYLYEPVDGAQRGILLIGNPVSMLLGLAAMVWAAARGIVTRDGLLLVLVFLYVWTLGFWAVADKPVQFYYHYLLPSLFLHGALALALDGFWQAGRKWLALLPLAASVAAFIWLFPILTAAELDGEMAFLDWALLEGWR